MLNHISSLTALSLISIILMNAAVISQGKFNFIAFVFYALFFFLLARLAKIKGYSPWMAIFGLLNLIGIILILALPENKPENR